MKLSHMIFQGPSVFENLMALRTRVLKGLHMFGFNVTFDIEFLRLMATLHTLPLASSETNHQRLKQVCKIKKTNDHNKCIYYFYETLPNDVSKQSDF